MSFATFNIKGYKKGLIGIGRHIDRSCKEVRKTGLYEDEAEKSLNSELGLHIDHSRSHLNEELVHTGGKSLSEMVDARIEEGYTKEKAIRSDAVKALGLVMTGSHDRMKEIESNQTLFESWKKANWDFACREFGGEKNIVRFSVHRDEHTPHIHCVVVPITQDGRLSAKEYRHGTVKLQGYQNRYAAAMAPFGLERGIETKLTGRNHTTTQEYYKSINKIEREVEQATKHINSLNPFYRDKAKKELENVQDKIRSLEEENKSLKRDVSYAQTTRKTTRDNLIKSDLERIKREVNLVQHVSSMGYVLDKSKSSNTWAVMEKEGDKVLIKNGPNQNGHWMYKSLVDDKDKGTIVDFMQNRGFTYQSICGLSSRHLDDRVIRDQKSLSLEITDSASQRYIAQEAFDKVVTHEKNNYLHCRGIDRSTYEHYPSVKVGDKAVFALYRDLDRNGKGVMCSTISYQFDAKEASDGFYNSSKYFQKVLPRGLSVLVDPNISVKAIVVTESPIDALSHKQIHKDDGRTMYISTCGSLSEGIKKELGTLLAHAKERGRSVTLAFDSDPAGRQMHKTVSGLARGHQAVCKDSIPSRSKDWGQELIAILGNQEMLKTLQKELVRSGQEHELRKQQSKEPTVMGLELSLDR
ncbi:MobV family relaxase [Candidatus Cardinium hertigii]|uniref:MobV family relaxase n=1 Tax=Candidatus Cardinium hertigii TaxID=247481 RepID=UPI003D7EC10C